jgi:hypothetical protein
MVNFKKELRKNKYIKIKKLRLKRGIDIKYKGDYKNR